MGQGSTARFVACTDPATYAKRLQLVRNVAAKLSTPTGLAAVEKQYYAGQAAFRTAFGGAFKGSTLDYWSSYGHGSLDWVPFIELFGTDNCPPDGQPLATVLNQLFPPNLKRSLRQPKGDTCSIPRLVSACSFDSAGTLAKCYATALTGHPNPGGPVLAMAKTQQGTQRRVLQGWWSNFLDWLQSCGSAIAEPPIPIVSGLITASDVAKAAGPQAVWGVMWELATQKCENRANDARSVIFVDSRCKESYEQDVGAFTVQCQQHPNTGISRPWGRGVDGCPNPPFYLKRSTGCSGPYRWAKKNS